MEDVKVYIETAEGVTVPFYAHATDAGMDVCANEDVTIRPGETKIVPTGIRVALPEGYELQVRPRSGMTAKTKLRIANTPGTIDAGFRGEIGIIVDNISSDVIHNTDTSNTYTTDYGVRNINGIIEDPAMSDTWKLRCSDKPYLYIQGAYRIKKRDRIAQLVLHKVEKAVFESVTDVTAIASDGRNSGGFGSTGSNI